jgi:crotonobetainyl-CoA:carnitine CoA-transferase CaiB-like acyl-CoA transferase
VTVVEFGGYAAGPAIGKYLADFGARVIHVESGSRPDGFRLQYPPFKDNKVGVNRGGCFATFNDSKLGVTVDVKHPSALPLLYRLIERADVLIENMRPGVITRLGLGYAALKARNPRLVMISTSNLGQTGPRATQPGFGSQLSSLSGFTELTGEPEGPPQCLYGPYIDMVAVAYGGAAVLAALDRQRRTGDGAFIDMAQYETGLQFILPALVDYSVNGAVAHRAGNRDSWAVPHGCFRSADGWVALSCWDDAEWMRLAELTGIAADPGAEQFRTTAARRADEAALNERISRWTAGVATREIVARLEAQGVHAAAVNTMRDLFDDPQIAARGVWQRRDHPEMGPTSYRMVSYQLSETPGRIHGPAPCLGQHNQDVFQGWLGLSDDEYQALLTDGVFS